MSDHKERISDLLDLGAVTKWEMGWLESVSEKLDRGHQLSEREEDILTEIEEKRL